MIVSKHGLPILLLSVFVCACVHGQEAKPATDGFQIKLRESVNLTPDQAYKKLVQDFSKWWDPSHSYSGKAENLSLDLKQRCMFEKLPEGGFVRHMEIVFHQPGKMLRMTGGLGPLQEMGVMGALTFKFTRKENETEIELTYSVVGYAGQNLDKISVPVKSVLSDQLARFTEHCRKKPNELAK